MSNFQLHGRISRRDLALNRQVWTMFGAFFALIAVATAIVPLLWPQFPMARTLPLAGGLGAVAVFGFVIKPPPMDSLTNHLVILLVSACTAGAMLAFAPTGVVPVGAAIFVGALAASRLQSRWQIAAHYFAASVILVLPLAVGTFDQTTVVGLASIIPAIWILGLCSVLVLEAAEEQGEELERLVRRDPLTGAGNRRLLHEELDYQFAGYRRSGQPISLLALDLDGFKVLNDVVGHDAGDALLRRVTLTLLASVRPQDTVVRTGGDDFCVVLPNTSADEAAFVQAAVRHALADLRGAAQPITASAAVATFPNDAPHVEGLLEVVEARVTVAKTTSRAAAALEPTPAVEPVPAALGVVLAEVITRQPLEVASPWKVGMIRVSRNEIARNRTVWIATGGMVSAFAALVALCIALAPQPDTIAAIYCTGLALAGALMLRSEPPRIGAWPNHLVIALPYVGSALFVLVEVPPASGALIGALAFTGPLAAIRLTDRRQIVGHYVLASVLQVVLVITGAVAAPMAAALLLGVLCFWGVGTGITMYLEAAEAQGDELEMLVRRDPLTGAGNRRLLVERLEQELVRHERTRKPLTLVALDLNGFKAVNDALGHAAGDELLCAVVDCVSGVVRPGDTVVRQSGDEFFVLFPETDSDGALPFVNAIRAGVQQLDAAGYPISTGAGMASFPADATSADVLMHAADTRLRHDKLVSPVRWRRFKPAVALASVRSRAK